MKPEILPTKADHHWRFLIGGDLMLGRAIDQIRPIHNPADFGKPDARHPDIMLRWAAQRGAQIPHNTKPEYFWGRLLAELQSDTIDFSLFNLETAVTTQDTWVRKTYNFRMHPAGLDVLKIAGIDCVSLANNHVLDFGVRGLVDTMDALREQNIGFAGAGIDEAQACAPAVHHLPGGTRLLLFAFACLDCGCRPTDQALPHRPGIQLLPELRHDAEPAAVLESVERVRQRIDTYRRPGDFIVLSLHWGGNWPQQIPEAHRLFAHRCVDALGIHLIHGHSAHIPLPGEIRNGSVILYGCGDVLNDYEGRPDRQQLGIDQGILFILDWDPSIQSLASHSLVRIRRHGFALETGVHPIS